ncbi:helix-turn-helix domain-containing protein [Agrobacterium sp.]|uniref:helix-turn-helix domain-containing protein n=1 Tax=Agrobacterium sp. TaxID=361 RepID=UPI0028AFC546|nr:helix-turn-helix domain-containing protein [Agrobacterium sp.]
MSILIMSRLFKAQLGSSSRKMLAVRLADFADDNGKGIWPSIDTLSQETELSSRTVQRLLADFVKEGLLVVVRKASGRPGEANRYDFDMKVVNSLPDAKAEPHTGDTMSPVNGEVETGDAMSRVTLDAETGDTDGRDGCHHVTRTVIEPPIEPSSERGAGDEVVLDRSETPGTAAFDKRVARFCNGEGYATGEWTGWTGSTLGYIAGFFAKLTPEERHEAEEHRDAFLTKCARDKVKPQPVSNYFRDKTWRALGQRDVAVAKELADRKTGKPDAGKPARWAASFSPPHAAAYFKVLLAGPSQPDAAPENGVWFRNQLQMAWPRLSQFFTQSDVKGGLVVSEETAKLAELMEFVPAASELMGDWRSLFKAYRWPEPKIMTSGGYFPKGGPEGLDAFAVAISTMGADHDAA